MTPTCPFCRIKIEVVTPSKGLCPSCDRLYFIQTRWTSRRMECLLAERPMRYQVRFKKSSDGEKLKGSPIQWVWDE